MSHSRRENGMPSEEEGQPRGPRTAAQRAPEAANLGEVYSDEWYRAHVDDAVASARVYVDHLWRYAQPRSVLDVGCGRGAWLKAFHEKGSQTLFGLDGPWNTAERMIDRSIAFAAADLDAPFAVPEKVELAMSLEVAEHLRPESSETFVRCLADASDLVLFGAAYPGQGGANHVNEQPHSYWARIFETAGFSPFDLFRPAFWADERVAFWYRQNTFLYARRSAPAYDRLVAQGVSPLAHSAFMDAVHPALYRLYQAKATEPVGFKAHLGDLIPSFLRGVRGLFSRSA